MKSCSIFGVCHWFGKSKDPYDHKKVSRQQLFRALLNELFGENHLFPDFVLPFTWSTSHPLLFNIRWVGSSVPYGPLNYMDRSAVSVSLTSTATIFALSVLCSLRFHTRVKRCLTWYVSCAAHYSKGTRLPLSLRLLYCTRFSGLFRLPPGFFAFPSRYLVTMSTRVIRPGWLVPHNWYDSQRSRLSCFAYA